MASLENLFATDPALPQCSTQKMPDNPGEWAEFLTTRLRELYADIANLPLSVEFRKKDDESGTAIGAIHVVSTESGRQVHVPFVVKKFELSPLDVWMDSKTQEVHPLTPDTFKEQFFLQASGEGLDNRPTDSTGTYFNDPSLWNTNYPPLQGRYSYASAGYPIMDAISDTLSEKDVASFRALLESEPEVLPLFKKHGHIELLKKIAAKKGKAEPMSNNFAESALKMLPTSIASLKRNGGDRYSILAYADRVFDFMGTEEHMSKDQCQAWLDKITGQPENFMNEVDQAGEKMLIMPQAPRNQVWLWDDFRDKPEIATEFATYRVKTMDGIGVEGLVFPHVVDFAGKKKPYKLFVSQKNSTLQKDIAGLKVVDSSELQKILVPGVARVGQTGTFVYIADGKAIATEPVTIKAVEEYGPLHAITLDGRKITISRGYAHSGHGIEASMPVSAEGKARDAKDKIHYLDLHGMIEQKPNQYVIPRHMLWLPMEGFADLMSSPDQWTLKEASAKCAGVTPTVVRYTGIVYELNGNGFEKQECSERMAKCALACQGASIADAERIIKVAKSTGRVQAYGLSPLKKKADIIKEAGLSFNQVEAMVSSVKPTDLDQLIKVAAEMEPSDTVDAILALNFVNPDNISKFVAYRPIFVKVNDALAELAIASRLGMHDIAESACVIGMYKLREVIQGLQKLEAGLLKGPANKIASANKDVKEGEKEHFANGMMDAEIGSPIHLDRARSAGAEAMLAYIRGKRVSETNQMQAKAMAQAGLPGAQPQGGKAQKAPQK